jgi:alpha,alpha-trehalose phosphorylase
VNGPDPWVIERGDPAREALGAEESIFALANGHLGLRGNLDEGEPRAISGTYLNGFYESFPLEYGERGYGFAEEGQTVVNVADGKIIRLLVENEPVDIERGRVERHVRRLDLRAGILERELVWCSAYGDRVRLRSRRLVSFVQRSVAAISFEVEPLDKPLRIALQSVLVADQLMSGSEGDPRAASTVADALQPQLATGRDLRAVLAHSTRRSGLAVAAGMDHVLDCPGEARVSSDVEEDLARVTVSARLEPGQTLKVEKFLAYHWSSRQTVRWLRDQVDASLENALGEGWERLARLQREFLDQFWDQADVELEGDDAVQQALRFALFHLIQAGARIEGQPIAAKGLTGTGYDGHAFWDTEALVLPVLTYVAPGCARDALLWRHSTLDLARERARQLGLAGAVLPWRTIHGEDCSGYWPAGLAAVHVNADVADAVRRYVQATGDLDFARGEGLELLVESARLWSCLGAEGRDGEFRIPGVTGPDEYSALTDDNVFTNLMAQANLHCAAEAVLTFPEEAARLGAGEEDARRWLRAADRMHIPYDEALGVHPQSAGFLQLLPFDFDAAEPSDYPLLLSRSYFDLYRRQVVKQADLVLALWFRGEAFDDAVKRRDFEYYEPITVRDSSLSACAQAVVAAEVGHVGLAWEYLREAAFTDLDDLHGNSRSGLHMASLAGAVLAVLCAIGGMRDARGELSFRPRVPEPVQRVAFRLAVRGSRLRVEIRPGEATYVVEAGDPLEIWHGDEAVEVGGEPVSRSIPEPPELDPPGHPRHRPPGSLCLR